MTQPQENKPSTPAVSVEKHSDDRTAEHVRGVAAFTEPEPTVQT